MAYKELDLTGTWQFTQYPQTARKMADLDNLLWHDTSVPSSIYMSLANTGSIDLSDIYCTPEKYKYVSEQAWVFRKTFDCPPDLFECDCQHLICEGLDTVATIWVNSKLIAHTDNMFIPHRLDVTGTLKRGSNTIMIKFDPPVEHATKLMKRYTDFSEFPFSHPHRVYLRKAQFQSGWDFCPPLPGCGIWRGLRIEAINRGYIRNFHFETIECDDESADVKLAIEIEPFAKCEFTCDAVLSYGDKTMRHSFMLDRTENRGSVILSIKNPKLWWPAGYGEHNLYTLTLELLCESYSVDHLTTKVGIRKIHVERDKDANGANFCFVVNDKPIYVRGTNWIPTSVFAGSQTVNDTQTLLKQAHNANVNMIRVWGGGYYESDDFYKTCDEIGLLVWQDFMFACAYYPEKRWFLKQVETEAHSIVRHLRNHPSIAIWCGSNEIDWMHEQGRLGSTRKYYGKSIWHKLLPQVVSELAPTAEYIPSTPIANKKDPQKKLNTLYHNWNIWSGYAPVRDYASQDEKKRRFVTEFGMQSLPGYKTLQTMCGSCEIRPSSFCIDKHNYQPDGNNRIYNYMADLFEPTTDAKMFSHLSQVTQARGLKTYVEALRSSHSVNNGAIFWQWHDCFPAVTWSAIDHNRQPKALYYYARRFFAPKLVICDLTEKTIFEDQPFLKPQNLKVINETSLPFTGKVECSLIDIMGVESESHTVPIVLSEFSKSNSISLPNEFIVPQQLRDRLLLVKLLENEKTISQQLFTFLPDKYMNWQKPQIQHELKQIEQNKWQLEVRAYSIIRDLQIDCNPDTQLSDNFFDLIPGEIHKIVITSPTNQVPSVGFVAFGIS